MLQFLEAITQADINTLKEIIGDIKRLSKLFDLPLKVAMKYFA